MAAPDAPNVAMQIAVTTPVGEDVQGEPQALYPLMNSGETPTTTSPTKQQLREEVQALKDQHRQTMAAAESAVSLQQDRARQALHYQDHQFRRAASEYEQEARDVQQVEVAQTRARIVGEASQAIQGAEHRLRAEAGQEIQQYATRVASEAENYVESQRDYILQEARTALEQERIRSEKLREEL